MRQAMAEAEVGDDVLDQDPTTRRLERRVAELLGQDDALFFPSGTQANQTAIALLTRPGTELLVEANAHLVHYELGGVAANWGVQIRPIASPDGLLSGDLVGAALRPASPHLPRAGAVAVENTHNAAGGRVMPPAVMDGIIAVARAAGLGVHLDGARLWNGAAALGVPPSRLARGAATVMVSFSKGLGCPVGSCLAFAAGERPRAWEIRKRLGARLLAERLGACPAVRVSVPETNILMIDLVRPGERADTLLPKLAAAGVLLVPFGARRLRAVTHLDVSRSDVARAADVITATLS